MTTTDRICDQCAEERGRILAGDEIYCWECWVSMLGDPQETKKLRRAEAMIAALEDEARRIRPIVSRLKACAATVVDELTGEQLRDLVGNLARMAWDAQPAEPGTFSAGERLDLRIKERLLRSGPEFELVLEHFQGEPGSIDRRFQYMDQPGFSCALLGFGVHVRTNITSNDEALGRWLWSRRNDRIRVMLSQGDPR